MLKIRTDSKSCTETKLEMMGDGNMSYGAELKKLSGDVGMHVRIVLVIW